MAEPLDQNIFGSTNSLGGLLNEELFGESDADQFLQELGGPLNKAFDVFAGTGAGSIAGVSLAGSTEDSSCVNVPSGAPTAAALFPCSLPTIVSTPSQTLPAESSAPPANNNLSVVSQLLGALQAAQQTASQPQQQAAPAPAGPQNLIAQLAAAFKPAAPPVQSLAPVSQATIPVAQPAASSALPSLNAQQQQALQTIISLGQLGNTSEGKKVRRMLSNRESARRSRHRKQAHVVELEERAGKLEAENAAMRASLAHASLAEAEAVRERAALYADLASLRTKVAQLESVCNFQTKATEVKVEAALKRGQSHGSSAGAGHTSEDSCCDSLPARRTRQEPCCKRCRTSEE